jgi:hypothetical protein
MKAIIENETASRSTQLVILQAFALIAALLAGVGLQGLIAFSVSNRLQETVCGRARRLEEPDRASRGRRRIAPGLAGVWWWGSTRVCGGSPDVGSRRPDPLAMR